MIDKRLLQTNNKHRANMALDYIMQRNDQPSKWYIAKVF